MNPKTFTSFIDSLKSFITTNLSATIRLHGCQILDIVNLSENELLLVEHAIATRRYEFSAGRFCAKKCLSDYGINTYQLLKGKFGEPLWPSGYTGSITHYDNIALSAVIQKSTIKSVGIDLISANEKLKSCDLIAGGDELLLLDEIDTSINSELLVFSIKEAVIKICSPLMQEFIDFRDIKLGQDSQGNLYASHGAIDKNMHIKWTVKENYIFSVATLNS